MQTIALSKIIISPDRQRQEFDAEALSELCQSITTHGLMHAPVLRRTDDDRLILVAGERRLKAIEMIYLLGDRFKHNSFFVEAGEVPYVVLGDLSPLEAEEAELEENLRRVDLTWQETAAATARLHALRQKQAEAIGGKHLLKDTAAELHPDANLVAATSKVTANLVLARNLDDPDIAKAKTARDAQKILAKREAASNYANLASSVGKTFNSSMHKLIHADCIEWMEGCEPEAFDVICTDPPYGMGAHDFDDGGGRLGSATHHYDDTPEAWRALMQRLCPALYRVAKRQAHAYIFCDFDKFHELKAMMQEAGWYVFRTPLISYKLNSGRVPLPDRGPRRQYELCLYAIKGDKKVTAIYSDVIPCQLEENLGHGANKPVELFNNLLKRSIVPGNHIFDPFAGTGTIFPAAHPLRCYVTGIEISPEYYGLAVSRLNSLDNEPVIL